MEEVNRRRRTTLQAQVEGLHLWRLSQSSSPRKCGFHLGFSLGPPARGVLLQRPLRPPGGHGDADLEDVQIHRDAQRLAEQEAP